MSNALAPSLMPPGSPSSAPAHDRGKLAHFGRPNESIPHLISPLPTALSAPFAPPACVPPRKQSQAQDIIAIFSYITPAFDHLLRLDVRPDINLLQDPPSIHVSYAAAVHAILSQLQVHHSEPDYLSPMDAVDLFYVKLDAYLVNAARHHLNALIRPALLPTHPNELEETRGKRVIEAYFASFDFYHDGLRTIDYLCRSINAQYVVVRDVASGGLCWLGSQDRNHIQRAKTSAKRTERMNNALAKWGYDPKRGQGSMQREAAILCVQAGSGQAVVVPVLALGLRRWRTEVLEPGLFIQDTFDDITMYMQRKLAPRSRKVLAAQTLVSFNQAGVDPHHHLVQDMADLLNE